MIERDVQIDGMRIHLAEAGEGRGLILLHGLSATHANWEHTIPAFADRWRVIAPDLPGHGKSAKPDAPYTIDFYAGVIRSLGRELGVREAVVMGNSLGGQIAIELGLSYPTWTRALVLAAPAGGFASAVRTFGWAIGAATGPRLLRLTERLVAEDFPAFARAVSRSLAGAIAAGQQPLHRLRQPTLFVWGRQDRMIGLAGGRRLVHAVRQARLVVLEKCGHLPMLEQAEEFNRVAADFLRTADAQPLPDARRVGGGE